MSHLEKTVTHVCVHIRGTKWQSYQLQPRLQYMFVYRWCMLAQVGVHIADVTHFIRPGSACDNEVCIETLCERCHKNDVGKKRLSIMWVMAFAQWDVHLFFY